MFLYFVSFIKLFITYHCQISEKNGVHLKVKVKRAKMMNHHDEQLQKENHLLRRIEDMYRVIIVTVKRIPNGKLNLLSYPLYNYNNLFNILF